MSNRILAVRVENRTLDPLSAELRITVRVERRTATTELRGKLTGPSCPYASTVELAYPLLPMRGSDAGNADEITGRVLIPEPSLWDPQSPFLYGGWTELWQDGECCDRVAVRHGLRKFSLGDRGLSINGKVFPLAGVTASAPDEASSHRLRDRGFNLLVVSPVCETSEPWDAADRFGFLVLGRVCNPDRRTEEQIRLLSHRPSCLGWLFRSDRSGRVPNLAGVGPMLGIEGTTDLPPGFHFRLNEEGGDLVLRRGDAILGRISGGTSAGD